MNNTNARQQVSENASLRHTVATEGVVIVDLSFKPIAFDRGAEAILKELNEQHFNQTSVVCLPPAIQEMLGAKSHLQLSAGNRQYSCRAFLMEPRNGSITQPLLALHLKRVVSVTDAVKRVALAYHLTKREQEAVVGVSMGLTSRELADRMNISPNTVNSFLRLIMVKMGVTTRAGVVGKLLDDSSTPADA